MDERKANHQITRVALSTSGRAKANSCYQFLLFAALLLCSIKPARAEDNTHTVIDVNTRVIPQDYIVGNTGANNTLLLTGSAIELYDYNGVIGSATTANGNSATVTGGALWANKGSLAVGLNGSGNSLYLNEGAAASYGGFVGYTANSCNNTVTLNGQAGVWSLQRDALMVGFYGSGNLLSVTNGGVLATPENNFIGNAASASNNTVVIEGYAYYTYFPSFWDMHGTGSTCLLIGNSGGSGNGLKLSNYGQLIRVDGVAVGGWQGSGSAGNYVNIISGGALLMTATLGEDFWIGNNAGANGNWVYVGSGNGVQSLLDLGASGKRLFVGGNNGATSNNWLTVDGGGLVNNGSIWVGNGNGNAMTITNGGQVQSAADCLIGFAASDANNAATVTGPGSAWNISSNLTVGLQGSGSALIISNGGAVNVGGNLSVSPNGTITFNGGTIISGGTSISNGADFVIGDTGGSAAFTANGGAHAFQNSLVVGNHSPGNALTIAKGGAVSSSGNSFIGNAAGANNNAAVIDGAGSAWNMGDTTGYTCLLLGNNGGNGNGLTLANGGLLTDVAGVCVGGWGGSGSAGNYLAITNGGKVVLTPGTIEDFWIGNNSGASNNWVSIGSTTGADSVLDLSASTKHLYIGGNNGAASGNQLTVSSGGVVTNGSIWIGNGSGNALTITDGGRVRNAADCLIGWAASDAGNSATITGSGSIWSISGNLYVGSSGSGSALTIADGGALVVTNATGNGTLDVRNGTLALKRGTVVADRFCITNGAGSKLAIELGNVSSGAMLTASGSAQLGGALIVTLGYTPAVGDTYALINAAGGVSGTFKDSLGNTLTNGATLTVASQSLRVNYTSTTVTLTVLSPTTTAIASSLNPSAYGLSVTFTATVSPSAATGTMTFKDGANTLGTGALSGGVATFTTNGLSAGSHSLTAEYAGDSSYGASTNSPALSQTVNKATPTATLVVNNSPVTYDGTAKAATVTVSASSVAGTAANILTGGAASQTSAGTYAVTADFVPSNTNYYTLTAQAAGNFVINKATPTATLAVNNSPVTYDGTAKAATVTVSASSVAGTAANILTGDAASQTAAGTYAVTADFVPSDTNYNTLTAQAAGNFVVSKATPTATLVVNNSPVTYDGTAKAATVTVSASSVAGAAANILTGGAASQMAAGTYAVTADFVPSNTNYNTLTAQAAGSFVINQVTTTNTLASSLNPSAYGLSVTLTSTLSPSGATGTVTFKDGTDTLGTGTLSGGVATFTTNGLSAGSHSLTAAYGGDGNYIGSVSSPLTQTVVRVPVQDGFWDQTATWGGALPEAGDDVVIPPNITVRVRVDPLLVRNLTVFGALTVNGAPTLQISGNFTNNGAFTPDTGTVTLTGDADQTLAATTPGALNFYKLIENKSGTTNTVTCASHLTVSNKLTLSKGKLVSASDYGDVLIEGDGELQLTSDIAVSGNFTNNGALSGDYGITFDGGTEQNLSLLGVTVFYNLTVAAGTTLIETAPNGKPLFVGGGATSNNRLTVDGGGLVNHGSIWVGNGNGNAMTITNGGQVRSAADCLIGFVPSDASNSATVTGPGSAWNISSNLTVGYQGYGSTLTISNGGAVNVGGNLNIGANAGAIGLGALNITGGTLTVKQMTAASAYGTITFNGGTIISGGTIRNGADFVIGDTGGHAAFTANGGAHAFQNSLVVGNNSSGNALTIANSGAVSSSGNSFIGNAAGANNNAAVIDGAGSAWNMGDTTGDTCLLLGNNGGYGNSLTLANGGLLTDVAGVCVGGWGGSGSAGNYLAMTNGGKVVLTPGTIEDFWIGNNLGANNNWVSIGSTTSADSVLDLSASTKHLYIGGNNGSASGNQLTVSSGGVVTNGSIWIGNGSGNALTITNGGRVWNAADCLIGWDASDAGNSATITGTGSIWSISGNLYVGSSGSGSALTVADGGALVVTNATGNGTLDVRNGTLALKRGTVVADRFCITNGAGSKLAIELGNVSSGAMLAASGSAQLGGALIVTLGYTPAVGDTYALINAAGGVSGTFKDSLGNTLTNGATLTAASQWLRVNYTSTTVTLTAVLPTTTALVSSLNPATVGASITFTSTVSPSAASGTMTFKDGANILGTGALSSGTATYATAVLSAGSHSITAEYAGDSAYSASTSAAVSQVVNTPPTASGFDMGGKRGEPSTVAVIGGKHPPADPDPGDAATLHITAVTQGSHGLVSTDGTNVTYIGTGGDSGTDSFTYTVSDRYGGTAVATVTVSIPGSAQGFNLVSATPIGGDQVRLTYLGVPGYHYALDRTDNLTYPIHWIPQTTSLADSVGQLIFTNQPDAATNNFWRTRYLP